MALSDAVQGGRHTGQAVVWQDGDGTLQDLTGATITAALLDETTKIPRAGDGTFTITGAAAGEFTWEYGVNDVAFAGPHSIQFTATFPPGSLADLTLQMVWMVRPAIVVPSP